MDIESLLNNYGIVTILMLACSAFTAGFIDAVVGGGGLIQTPFLLITFPKMPLPVLFGTNKIAALAGTSIAAIKYAKKITFNYKLLFVIALSCFISSFLGAQIINHIDSNALKPVILIILIIIAIYTFVKKDLGAIETKELPLNKQMLYGSVIGLIVGFYDGFFGPGTGSFFVLGFVVVLGFEFVKASAYAKIVNCITNISALIVFIKEGHFILHLAILLALFNIAGSFIGSHLALKKGNGFVRIIFLVIVSVMILKYGYDVLKVYF
ncbi:MAG: TSUP family transporter [Bacteroidetes bacterium]|nr:TSUP family transporter [Bacteroidota bacterium]